MISVCVSSLQGFNCSGGYGRVSIRREERGKYHFPLQLVKMKRTPENIQLSLKCANQTLPYCLTDGVHFTTL